MASRIPNVIEDVEHVFRVKLLADDLKLMEIQLLTTNAPCVTIYCCEFRNFYTVGKG